MSRSHVVAKIDKKPMNPIWRGIGCLTIVIVFVLAFMLSSWFIDRVIDRANPLPMPTQLKFLPSALRNMTSDFRGQFPWFGGIGKYIPSLLFSAVTALLIFGLIGVVYAIFRGDHNDPKDVRNWEPPGRKKRKVRRCR